MKVRSWVQKYSNPTQKNKLKAIKSDVDAKIIGISGTVGKTSVAELTYQYLLYCGFRVAMVGTSGIYKVKKDDKVVSWPCTAMPNKELLCDFLIECLLDEAQYIVLETTAESTAMRVYENLDFEVVGITPFLRNIVRSFSNDDEYFRHKISLFNDNNIKFVSISQNSFKIYYKYLDHSKKEVEDRPLYLYDKNEIVYYTNKFGYLTLVIGNETFTTSLLSSVNVDNILCFFGIMQGLKLFDPFRIKVFLNQVTIPGRLESFMLLGRYIVIDTGYNGVDGVYPYFMESSFPNTYIVLSTYFFDSDKDSEPLTKLYRQNKALFFSRYADGKLILSATCATKEKRNIPDEELALKQMAEVLVPNTYEIYKNRIAALDAVWKMSKPGDRIFITGMGTENYAAFEENGEKHFAGDKEIIQYVVHSNEIR